MFCDCAAFPELQFKGVLQAGSSRLPLELLEQTRLQLLQALASPVQLLLAKQQQQQPTERKTASQAPASMVNQFWDVLQSLLELSTPVHPGVVVVLRCHTWVSSAY